MPRFIINVLSSKQRRKFDEYVIENDMTDHHRKWATKAAGNVQGRAKDNFETAKTARFTDPVDYQKALKDKEEYPDSFWREFSEDFLVLNGHATGYKTENKQEAARHAYRNC